MNQKKKQWKNDLPVLYGRIFFWCDTDDVLVCFQVWKALLKEMPLQSLMKILGKMTAKKILEPGSADTQAVCDKIRNETTLKKVSPAMFAF